MSFSIMGNNSAQLSTMSTCMELYNYTLTETVQTDNITTTVIETSNILQTDSFAVTTSLSPTSLTLLGDYNE